MKLKTQKVTVSILAGIICVTLVLSTFLYIQKWQNSIIPNQIVFKINNEPFQQSVEKKIHALVQTAQKENSSRATLLKSISTLLNKYDVIDKYSLRLGFDHKLTIFANIQNPVLAIHTQNKNVYILGNAMKLIDKNPNSSILKTIPNIYMNDTTIKDKYDQTINYAQLLKQVSLINENYQWYNTTISQINWTHGAGFILTLESENQNLQNSINSPLTIYLGHKDLDKKIKKFKSIETVLKQKNLKPNQIDLDLLDRAFIK